MATQSLANDIPAAFDILTEQSGAILSIQLNRPTKKNSLTSSMYTTMANVLDRAARDESIRVVLWHAAGDAFSAGNDIADFLNNPPGPGDSPQRRLTEAFIAFEKPIVAFASACECLLLTYSSLPSLDRTFRSSPP